MKIKIDLEKCKIAVEKCIKKAAEYRKRGGEVQLYARHNGEEATEFFTEVFAGHNNWLEGENIIGITTQKWFYPIDHLHMDDELKNELDGDSSLLEEYREILRKNAEGRYDGYIEDNLYKWATFSELLPEKAEEIILKWEEIALDEIIEEKTSEVIDRVEERYDVEWL
ncbi:hypothetical protein B7C51_24615 (plasmid) [Paenibacillus larvae subsp. pulvifaciens]|uniref:Uncharacterized protein n=1 Tax=Paenibacillus larvae subsp. pulvifaciens TaxID=1477 RepID=A0A1V0UZY8_9BACL|nr:hypothetical protein [Paenibacillus larvae]ARF70661.1 hypothetical protein B7C51_24615 [Paenibacillus larvae subsp. pulvifaciens]